MACPLENDLLCSFDLSRTRELIGKIEQLIRQKGMKPGIRLGNKKELCLCFRVSPGTLNEVLRVLETRGIVELRRGSKGGVFVAAVSMQPCLDQVSFGAKREAVEQCIGGHSTGAACCARGHKIGTPRGHHGAVLPG